MENSTLFLLGYWTCRVLDSARAAPHACDDYEWRGTIGLVSFCLLAVFCVMFVLMRLGTRENCRKF